MGQLVRFQGLTQKAALNGRLGLVLGFDAAKVRLVVEVRPVWAVSMHPSRSLSLSPWAARLRTSHRCGVGG